MESPRRQFDALPTCTLWVTVSVLLLVIFVGLGGERAVEAAIRSDGRIAPPIGGGPEPRDPGESAASSDDRSGMDRPSMVPGFRELLALGESGFEGGTARTQGNLNEARDPERVYLRSASVPLEGAWTEAGPQGVFELRDEAGLLRARGEFDGGLAMGTWERWHPDGVLQSRGTFSEGLESGPWREWDASGRCVAEAHFERGLLQGPLRSFGPGGQLARETEYRDGMPHGQDRRWHDDGSLFSEGQYEDGKREGSWSRWHANGTPMETSRYQAGEREGDWSSWYSTGQIRESGVYRLGLREGRWEFWFPDGTPEARSGEYRAGKKLRD